MNKTEKISIYVPEYIFNIESMIFAQYTDGGGVPEPYGQISVQFFDEEYIPVTKLLTFWQKSAPGSTLSCLKNQYIKFSSLIEPKYVAFKGKVMDSDNNPDDILADTRGELTSKILGNTVQYKLPGGEDEISCVLLCNMKLGKKWGR